MKLEPSALRPALKAIILSLLPGLEDETSEDFERIFAALDKLRTVVQAPVDESKGSGSSHFWQCFFLATITNASRRQGALAFLVRRLPKFGLPIRSSTAAESSHSLSTDAEAAISPEPGLLIRCFESGLVDQQLLIQRGFLDLLVSHLPLDSPVLQDRVGKADLERLVTAAAGVVSRRDMSLNRRLWAWFLGPEPTASEAHEQVTSPTHDKHDETTDPATQHAAFFSRYGLEALTSSVLNMIRRPTRSPAERARPFRVCLSLMDRWEVGGLIVPDIFMSALQSVQSYCETASKDQSDEVMRSASAFFDGVDSGLIWGKLISMVTSALDTQNGDRKQALGSVKLAKFVLARFNLKEEDMLLHHMPLMIMSTLASLNAACGAADHALPEPEVVDIAFEIAESLIQIVPDRTLRDPDTTDQQISHANAVATDVAIQRLRAFYEDSQGSLDAADPPFSATELSQFLLREAVRIYKVCVQSDACTSSLDVSARILACCISKIQHLNALDGYHLFDLFQNNLVRSAEGKTGISFCHLNAATTVLGALQTSRPSAPYVSMSAMPEIVHPLVVSLWQFLSPTKPKYHVEATRCLLQLHTIAPASRMVEAAISSVIESQLTQRSSGSNVDDCSRYFAVLWTHTMYELNMQTEKRGSVTRRPSGNQMPAPTLASGDYHAILTRPLLLFLETLDDQGSEASAFLRTWIQDLPSLVRVFDILVRHIQALKSVTISEGLVPISSAAKPRARTKSNDSKDCLYYLRHIDNILQAPSQFIWATLADAPAAWAGESSPQMSLQEWIVRTCLNTMAFSTGDENLAPASHVSDLHRLSVNLLFRIYQSPFTMPLRELEVEVPLIARLRTAGPSLQSLLLKATLSALKLRLTRPPQEQSQDLKVPSQPTHRSRLSLALNRESEDQEPAPSTLR